MDFKYVGFVCSQFLRANQEATAALFPAHQQEYPAEGECEDYNHEDSDHNPYTPRPGHLPEARRLRQVYSQI